MHDAVLIVCGGLLQVPAVHIARELGLKVIVTDGSADAPAMKLADEAVILDIYDVQRHRELVKALAQRYNLRGVFTEGADVEVTVAAAAESAGLPGIRVEAARNTKNKVLTRGCFDRSGIPNPRWAEVRDGVESRQGAERIGFPLMVKAVDNCASRGTTRVADPKKLLPAVKLARRYSSTGTALLESCFVGDEQSVEILFDGEGRCHRLNIVDRPFQAEGDFAIELGHVNPTRLGLDDQSRLFDLTESAARATGVNFGAFKADTIWTAEGPRILEVTARLSGGFDCQYTTPLATGRNFIRAAMRLAVRLEIDPVDLESRWRRHAAAWVAFPEPGRIERISGMEDALRLPGVHHVFLRTKPGDLIEPYRDCAARPAFVIAVGATPEEAIARAQAGVGALKFETTPAQEVSNPV
jgi:biotin carboxylase